MTELPPHDRQSAADEAVRVQAVYELSSCIVQAPAGAGKTELLIQRMLRLLATVDEPEEVVALTFTRKAAAEMRQRLHGALVEFSEAGEDAKLPAYRQRTRNLARAALERSAERGWQLEANPARLRISTIDALNTAIARGAPTVTGGAGLLAISEKPKELYALAAENAISHVADSGRTPESEAARTLLIHLGNRVDRLVNLISEMLARRDQWLRLTLEAHSQEPAQLRQMLEAHLGRVVDHVLDESLGGVPGHLWPELTELTRYAANRLADTGDGNWLAGWVPGTGVPSFTHPDLDLWHGFAQLWFTKAGEWRKSLNKNQGFPPDDRATKQKALELLATLRASVPDSRIGAVAGLPAPEYADDQWAALSAALTLLRVAAAELKLVFKARGETDFSEIASDALLALGGEESPTDLALLLDYTIRHILVDEFQDTSRAQFELLGALVRGWEPSDGRTLFVVGDPMQSIYRFREADVGLYLVARDIGIGGISLTPLELTQNFRSSAPVVEWVNDIFSRLAPTTGGDAMTGAVAFSPSVAGQPTLHFDGIETHVDYSRGGTPQGQIVTDLVRDALAQSGDHSVGVLVRSRSHAREVVRSLTAAGIDYQGADLSPLHEMSFVQDLLALTRAICHPADRIAWLAILRAPWCGLSLADLERLVADDPDACIVELLRDDEHRRSLGPRAIRRIERLLEALEPTLAARGALGLHDLVHGAWQRLAGAATLRTSAELGAVRQFFRVLETIDKGGDYVDNETLAVALEDQTGQSGSVAARVQVMTIHKAKGLEFDTVILPGLGMTTRSDTAPILAWRELATAAGPSLLMSPIEGYGATPDALFRLIRRLEKEQEEFEMDRLLYVACTRARHRLHLVGQLPYPSDESEVSEPAPAKGTLLDRVWPALAAAFLDKSARPASQQKPPPKTDEWVESRIERLKLDWRPAAPAPDVEYPVARKAEASTVVVYDWATRQAMQVGRAVHFWLRTIAEDGLSGWDSQRVESLRPAIAASLLADGIGQRALPSCLKRVEDALARTLADDTGRWILGQSHTEAHSEFELVLADGGGWRRLVIDRLFIGEDGVAWIVDYKTSSHEGGDLDRFLEEESDRYRPQLGHYRAAWTAYRGGEVRTGLYFPLLSRLIEV